MITVMKYCYSHKKFTERKHSFEKIHNIVLYECSMFNEAMFDGCSSKQCRPPSAIIDQICFV